jgi:glutathione peroxidase
MKKFVIVSIIILCSVMLFAQNKTFHDFKVKKIDGDSMDFSILAGKKVLVVNTASYCGYTDQYTNLQNLYEDYGPDNFTIIAFPSNDFNNQEPGSDEDILNFCTSSYGITFPLMSKIHVKGVNIHPVYKWLSDGNENGVRSEPVMWNFQKYLIDEQGRWVDMIPTQTNPESAVIINWITNNNALSPSADGKTLQYQIYPSPLQRGQYLHIDCQNIGRAQLGIQVINALGRVLFSEEKEVEEKSACLRFDPRISEPGLYFVVLEGAGKTHAFKLMCY